MQMQIYIFGNIDLETDSLPVQLIPDLEKTFPEHTFTTLDPNEEWDVPNHMIIIDTIVGIRDVIVFQDLHAFLQTPRVTCHDFDAYTNLQFLVKLGKVKEVTIIGIPVLMPEGTVLEKVVQILRTQIS